jgi:hypothetical protein
MKRNARIIHRIPIEAGEARLGRMAQRLHARKEYAILEKDGVPLAGVVSMDEFEDLMELHDADIKRQIAEGYAEYRRGEAQPVREFLATLGRARKRAESN